jgi:arylsulfatase A-like enzyme
MFGLAKVAVVLGVVSGVMEVALRAEPRLGLGIGETGVWLALAIACGLAVALPAALVAWFLPRSVGWVAAALLVLHGALFYRFDVVLNLFVRDPRVWGGLIVIALASLVLGLALSGMLERMMAPLVAVGLLAVPVALVRASPGLHDRGGDGPNILLVTLDTTRPDRLGPYGGPAKTPVLDRLAREGVVFDQAIAPAPLTEPSHLSLLTGQPTSTTGVRTNGTPLGDRPALLSRRLQEAGWTTGGFVSGFPLHGKWGWTQGFDIYDDDFGAIPGLHRLSLVKLWEQFFLPGNTLRERTGDYTAGRALAFLGAVEGPWFAWVHLFDAHAPYEAPGTDIMDAPRRGKALALPAYWPPPHRAVTSTDWLLQAYDAEIAFADARLGDLVAAVEARGELDETLIIVTADHGESLTEHDYLFDHGDFLFDASLRIPLVVRGPGVRAGQRVECQVRLFDVGSTIALAAGLSVAPAEGRSLWPDLAGKGCESLPVLSSTVAARFVEDPPTDWSLRTDGWKLIHHGVGGAELYDLAVDPEEMQDLADSEAARLADLEARLQATLIGASEEVAPARDAATVEALRALGYIE